MVLGYLEEKVDNFLNENSTMLCFFLKTDMMPHRVHNNQSALPISSHLWPTDLEMVVKQLSLIEDTLPNSTALTVLGAFIDYLSPCLRNSSDFSMLPCH